MSSRMKNLYNNVYKGIKHKKEGGYMEKVIEVKNLYKLYRVGDEVVRALDGVDFNIYKGEFCAIVGTSGSGKSTLLRLLSGLASPTSGTYQFHDQPITTTYLADTQNRQQLHQRIGMVFQNTDVLNVGGIQPRYLVTDDGFQVLRH